MNFKIGLRLFVLAFIFASIPACVNLVEAEYDYKDNVLFIDAYALTEPGASSVTIKKSVWNESSYSTKDELNAIVSLENIETQELVAFYYSDSGAYICPPNFAVQVGETWKLNILLNDNKKIESKPETVIAPIPIENIRSEYSPEVIFDATRSGFIPGHKINIDWKDPAGEENYYLWKYKTYQPLFVCKTCTKGVLRNGECESSTVPWFPAYYNYLCTPDCWQIDYGTETIIFEDRLSDGATLSDYQVAIIPYYRRPDILIELQQFSVTKSAYEYFKVIKDQVNASGGLNAPPAAPLLGNLFSPEDSVEFILGNFTTAGVASKSIFIDRSEIAEPPSRPDDFIRLEPGPLDPTTYPCHEGRTRTAIKPEGWQ